VCTADRGLGGDPAGVLAHARLAQQRVYRVAGEPSGRTDSGKRGDVRKRVMATGHGGIVGHCGVTIAFSGMRLRPLVLPHMPLGRLDIPPG
jgi:hypothetical protein